MATSTPSLHSTTWTEDGLSRAFAISTENRPPYSESALFGPGPLPFGQYAAYRKVGPGVYEAVRDPIGVGKLFYTTGADGQIVFSREFTELLKGGTKIFSVPRGCHVLLGPGGERRLMRKFGPPSPGLETISGYRGEPAQFFQAPAGQLFQQRVRARLEAAFEVIRSLEDDGYTVFIALSGGLDSSAVASLAHRHLRRAIAFTLDLGRSEDAEKSALIARDLGIAHTVFQTSRQEILDAVAEAPVLCQDFRDFNVHCAALNLLLAKNIAAYAREHRLDPDKLVVLTGDQMNEFTCDYAEEVIDGVRYYRLPRVDKKQLQENLIGGLDTSDRELLPFAASGILCVQPYAAVFDLYEALPEAVLELPDPKKLLNAFLVSPQIMGHLPKSKLRAQVGSKESMGVLGLCHAMKIDEKVFLQALVEPAGATKELVPIYMGRYLVEEFTPA